MPSFPHVAGAPSGAAPYGRGAPATAFVRPPMPDGFDHRLQVLSGDAAFAAVAEPLPPVGDANAPIGRGLRVLLVDADPLVTHELRQFLARFDVSAVLAASPAEAREACELVAFDVIVTATRFRPPPAPTYLADLLARCPDAGLVVACGRVGARLVNRLYAAGADLVVQQPYDQEQLLERLLALARRRARWGAEYQERTPPAPDASPTPAGWVLRLGALTVDLDAAVVRGGARVSRLTHTEVQLLRALAARGGAPVSRADLIGDVWGEVPTANWRRVDTAVVALRRKLEPRPDAPQYLVTVTGVGYRLTQVAAPTLAGPAAE